MSEEQSVSQNNKTESSRDFHGIELGVREIEAMRRLEKDDWSVILKHYNEWVSFRSNKALSAYLAIGIALSLIAYIFIEGSFEIIMYAIALFIVVVSLSEMVKKEGHREGFMDGYNMGFDDGINKVLGIDREDDTPVKKDIRPAKTLHPAAAGADTEKPEPDPVVEEKKYEPTKVKIESLD